MDIEVYADVPVGDYRFTANLTSSGHFIACYNITASITNWFTVSWPDSTTQLLKMVHLIVGYEPRDITASITSWFTVCWPDSTTQLLKWFSLIVGYEPRDTNASVNSWFTVCWPDSTTQLLKMVQPNSRLLDETYHCFHHQLIYSLIPQHSCWKWFSLIAGYEPSDTPTDSQSVGLHSTRRSCLKRFSLIAGYKPISLLFKNVLKSFHISDNRLILQLSC